MRYYTQSALPGHALHMKLQPTWILFEPQSLYL